MCTLYKVSTGHGIGGNENKSESSQDPHHELESWPRSQAALNIMRRQPLKSVSGQSAKWDRKERYGPE
jgi:hypothetical protein